MARPKASNAIVLRQGYGRAARHSIACGMGPLPDPAQQQPIGARRRMHQVAKAGEDEIRQEIEQQPWPHTSRPRLLTQRCYGHVCEMNIHGSIVELSKIRPGRCLARTRRVSNGPASADHSVTVTLQLRTRRVRRVPAGIGCPRGDTVVLPESNRSRKNYDHVRRRDNPMDRLRASSRIPNYSVDLQRGRSATGADEIGGGYSRRNRSSDFGTMMGRNRQNRAQRNHGRSHGVPLARDTVVVILVGLAGVIYPRRRRGDSPRRMQRTGSAARQQGMVVQPIDRDAEKQVWQKQRQHPKPPRFSSVQSKSIHVVIPRRRDNKPTTLHYRYLYHVKQG